VDLRLRSNEASRPAPPQDRPSCFQNTLWVNVDGFHDNPSRSAWFAARKVLFQAVQCGTITWHEKRVHKQTHQRNRLASGSAGPSACRKAHRRFENGFGATLVGHRHVHSQGQVEAPIPLMLSHSLAIGYHGCDRNLASRIVAGETELKPSLGGTRLVSNRRFPGTGSHSNLRSFVQTDHRLFPSARNRLTVRQGTQPPSRFKSSLVDRYGAGRKRRIRPRVSPCTAAAEIATCPPLNPCRADHYRPIITVEP
jgi:hypothetical protein